MEIVNLPLDLDYEIAKHLDYDNLKNLSRTSTRYSNFCQTDRGLELLRSAKDRIWEKFVDHIMYWLQFKGYCVTINIINYDEGSDINTKILVLSYLHSVEFSLSEAYPMGDVNTTRSDFLLNEIDKTGRYWVQKNYQFDSYQYSSFSRNLSVADMRVFFEKIKGYKLEAFPVSLLATDVSRNGKILTWDPKI